MRNLIYFKKFNESIDSTKLIVRKFFYKKIIKIKNLFKKNINTKRFISDDEFNDMRNQREKKLNSILDKISKSGYKSLSNHEKNFLDNYK